jgi:RNA polymerase sigma factor (sigma-70 family)
MSSIATARTLETSGMSGAGHWDASTFEAFYATHAAALYRHVFFRAGMDSTAASEIVASIFAAVWTQSAPATSDEQYLYGIARRKLTDYYRERQRNREIRFSDLNQGERQWIGALFEDAPPDTAPLLSQAAAQLIGEALTSLDPETQTLLVEKYIRSASIKDLASKSGKSEAAMTSLLARARKKLRDALVARIGQGRKP